MPYLEHAINLDEVEEGDYSRIPLEPGTYLVEVIDSELKENRSGTGSYLKFTFRVAEGEKTGKRLWSKAMNIIHQNETAQSIARQELKALAGACGVSGVIDDSAILHGRFCYADVDVDEYNGRLVNIVEGYSAAARGNPPAKKKVEPEQVSFDDDDIPF